MGKRGRSKKQKDYTTPIDFVAGGIQQSGRKNEEKGIKPFKINFILLNLKLFKCNTL